MRMKKVLALTTAVSMLLASSLTTLAADDAGSVTFTGGTAVTEDGEMHTAETVIYKVKLPTSGALQFYLDPLGLYGYFSDETNTNANPNQSALGAYAGKIVSSYAVVENKSSVPVYVDTAFYVTAKDAAGTDASSILETVGTKTAASAGKLGIRIEPMKKSGDEWVTDTTTVAELNAAVAAASAETLKYGVAGGTYEFGLTDAGEYTYTLPADAPGGEIAFQVNGLIDAATNWKGYQVALSCVYNYRGIDVAATETALSADWDTAVSANTGIINSTDESSVKLIGTGIGQVNAGPSFTATSYNIASGTTTLTIPVNLGSGDDAMASVEGMNLYPKGSAKFWVTDVWLTITDNGDGTCDLVLNSDCIDWLKEDSGAVCPATVEVWFRDQGDNLVQASENITLKYVD